MRSFVDDPVMRWLVPDDEDYFAPGGELFRGVVTNWVALGEVWCTDDAVALAAWIPPGRPEVQVEVDPPVAPPPPERVERFKVLGPLLDANSPPEPHWYLQMLATHPDWQRQGLGAELMASMFERSDAEGLAGDRDRRERCLLPAPRLRCSVRVGRPRRPAHVGHAPACGLSPAVPVPGGLRFMWGMLRPAA